MKIYHNTTEILDLLVDDSSVRYRTIMGDNSLTLNFSTVEPVNVPIGSYCEFEGQRYTLFYPENFRKHNTRNFEYTLVLHANQEALKLYKFKDLSTKPYRLKFILTATAQAFLQLLVDNMNEHDTGWLTGDCIVADDKLISFNHEYCYDVLNRIAQEFNTEWEVDNKTIHFRKVEKFKDAPLALSYGKGNGFKSGVGRQNEGDKQPIGRLYVQGGERNIDYSQYGSQSLLLPQSATLIQDGKTYRTDAGGMYITRDGNNNPAEDSWDAADFYPRRVGTVSSVVVVDAGKHFYNIIDDSIPSSLNYADCRIAGEKATIVFQSGALAGREFDIQQTETALTGYNHSTREFQLVPAEMDGFIMPGGVFIPETGDKYVVFNISMPPAYISDEETKTGASWDMFRESVRYFADNEDAKFVFRGELDGVWSRDKWLQIGGKIVPGGHVLFSDTQFQPEGVKIRITSIKDYVNMPHKPEITLSNAPVSMSFASDLGKLEAEEVVREEQKKELVRYNKRTWANAKETMSLLENAFLNFDTGISPLFVQTMQLLAGDESLQYRFVTSKSNPVQVNHTVEFDAETKILTANSGIIQHMTLGISTLKKEHSVSEYMFWDMYEYQSPVLDQPDKAYYLYAKVTKLPNYGEFLLSESAIEIESINGYYCLLVGILNSELDGERSFISLYGFTEILPGRITTDKIVSNDGKTYIDLVNSEIVGKIRFLNENNEEQEIETIRLFIQYSANGLFWHDTFTTGDKYMRQKNGVDGTWSDAIPITGTPGASSYTHIRYSQNANGNPMTANSVGAKYIGIVVNTSPTAPSDYSAYSWTLIKGEPGQSSYTHIRYSQNATGNPMTTDSVGAKYMGIAVTTSPTAPTSYSAYSWTLIRGEGSDGEDGDGFVIRFMRSESKPPAPATGLLNPDGWMSSIDKPRNHDIYWPQFVGNWQKQANGEYKSEPITHNQNSPFRLNFYNRTPNEVLNLRIRTSTENADKIHVGKLDEELGVNYANAKMSIGGIRTEQFNYILPTAGEHFILFDYKKDSTVSSYDDAVYLLVEFPTQKIWMTIANIVAGVMKPYSEPVVFVDSRIEETIAEATRTKAITDKFGTTIDGGLVQTVVMLLREANTQAITAGISGIQGLNRNHPAFWAGGTQERALALVEFLSKISNDIVPDANEYFNLAKIIMLHNGASKLGDLIIEESGRVFLVDPTTGKQRLVLSAFDLPDLQDILEENNFSGSANIGSGSCSTTTPKPLSGSLNITKDNARVTFSPFTFSFEAQGQEDPNGNPHIVSGHLWLKRNGLRFYEMAFMGFMFDSPDTENKFDSTNFPAKTMTLPSGNYTFELEVKGIFAFVASGNVSTTAFVMSWSFDNQIRQFQFGLNGMMAYFTNNHIYFTEDEGWDVRGQTNMPGVLASGTVNINGGLMNTWGAKVNYGHTITGGYRIYLKEMDHDQYSVQVTPHTNVTFKIGVKTSTYFEILGTGAADFVVLGNNY